MSSARGDMPAASPLRIAAHISAAEWGGAERRSLALLAALADRGHDIIIYCNTQRIAEKARAAGLHAVRRPLRGDAHLHNAVALARALRRQQPDALLLITFRRLWLGALAARLARVPRVIARIGLASDIARNAKYRFVLRRWIDDVVVNADSLRQPFIDALPDRARSRVTVIPNGVDTVDTKVSRAQARTALGLPQDAFVVGTVARLVTQKRIDRMIRAVATLDGVYAVVAGDGALRQELEQLSAEVGTADRIKFIGARDELTDVHAALDVYVVASDQEGMSSAMLEAMAAGVPVISTRVSGAAEALLGEPAAGMVVAPEPAALADAVRTLRDEPARRRELGEAAARTVVQRFGAKAMVDAWERLLLRPTSPYTDKS